MNSDKLGFPDLIVVDANRDEYRKLAIALCLDEGHIRLFATGGDALRATSHFPSALWVVNIRLPDMPGVVFLKLIRHRLRRCRVILVGDDYSAEDELTARSAGATAYVCKPASTAWLAGCRSRRRSSAIRAGPSP